jgi:hypothetical protein
MFSEFFGCLTISLIYHAAAHGIPRLDAKGGAPPIVSDLTQEAKKLVNVPTLHLTNIREVVVIN